MFRVFTGRVCLHLWENLSLNQDACTLKAFVSNPWHGLELLQLHPTWLDALGVVDRRRFSVPGNNWLICTE